MIRFVAEDTAPRAQASRASPQLPPAAELAPEATGALPPRRPRGRPRKVGAAA